MFALRGIPQLETLLAKSIGIIRSSPLAEIFFNCLLYCSPSLFELGTPRLIQQNARIEFRKRNGPEFLAPAPDLSRKRICHVEKLFASYLKRQMIAMISVLGRKTLFAIISKIALIREFASREWKNRREFFRIKRLNKQYESFESRQV